MADILCKFNRKERGSSSTNDETSMQVKRFCGQERNELTDEILLALDISKDNGEVLTRFRLARIDGTKK